MPEDFDNKKGRSRETRPPEEHNRPRRRKKKKRGCLLPVVSLLVIISLLAAFLADKYMPNFQRISFYEFYEDTSRDRINVMLADKWIKESGNPVIEEGEVYLPVDFVKEHIDKYIFWDESANRLTITTENKVLHMRTQELTYYVNHRPMELSLPVYNINGSAYLPQNLLESLYNVDIIYRPEYKTVVVDYTDEGRQMGQISVKKAAIRYAPDRKSPIAEELPQSSEVDVYESDGDYIKVRTATGLIGYIHSKQLTLTGFAPPEPEKNETREDIKPIQGDIVLLWDQMTNVVANSNDNRRINHRGVNVLSPTWFLFDEEKLNGDIISIADKSYVEWAHANGYQVWALIADSTRAVSHAVLTDTTARENVIRQLLAFVQVYDLDGINVDFEKVTSDDAPYFLQFLRELSPLLNQQGVVLSVDMFVPTYTKYYMRDEVAKVVDYICVMTYDEHTSVSPESGPVASLGFVDDGISATLLEVPADKLLMGIPFYVRVWKEETTSEGMKRSLSNYSMDYAYRIFRDNGAEFTWLEDIGSYYAEYKVLEKGNEVLYRVWLEDERSIEEKMKLYNRYDLAGIACWKRGLEKDIIWDVIAENMK